MSKQKTHIVWYFLASIIPVLFLLVAIFLNDSHRRTDVNQDIDIIDIDNGDLNIAWHRFDEYYIELTNSLKIENSGVYYLTGSLTDQNVTINVPEGKIKLVLDNVTIKNSTGPAIVCYMADDLVIELVGENKLEGGLSRSISYDADVDGVIYSKSDLTMQGDGVLNLTAHYQDGIVGKDDIKFNSGTYNITAADDGIRGKDSVYIVDGFFNINAKSNTIKSTNETKAGKGFVLIEKGELCLTSGISGIYAAKQRIISEKVNFCHT